MKQTSFKSKQQLIGAIVRHIVSLSAHFTLRDFLGLFRKIESSAIFEGPTGGRVHAKVHPVKTIERESDVNKRSPPENRLPLPQLHFKCTISYQYRTYFVGWVFFDMYW